MTTPAPALAMQGKRLTDDGDPVSKQNDDGCRARNRLNRSAAGFRDCEIKR